MRSKPLLVLVVGVHGCALFLPHAKPDELSALDQEKRATLLSFQDARVAATTGWQFAIREREIAERRRAAAEALRDVPVDLARWARLRAEAARAQLDSRGAAKYEYCAQRFTMVSSIGAAEREAQRAALRAARRLESEMHARMRLAEAEEERARIAAALDRPGVEREKLDRAVRKWDKEVERRRLQVIADEVARRQAAAAAADQEKLWKGAVDRLTREFAEPCRADWQIGEATAAEPPAVTSPPPAARALGDESPLAE